MPYIHICLYYFLILCFYFQLFDTLLTRRHSTNYNVWFDFITSVRKLKSNLELNNPKLTSDTIGKFILCTLRCWKGHWWPLGEKVSCLIRVKGRFWLIFIKWIFWHFLSRSIQWIFDVQTLWIHIYLFIYFLSYMILFTFLDINYDKEKQKLIQFCDLIKWTDRGLKQGKLWWTTWKNTFFRTYINLLIVINAGTVFVLFL